MRLRDALDPFLLYGRVEKMYASQTLDKFRECLRSRILPCLGDVPLAQLGYLDILALRKKMVDDRLSTARQYNVLMVLKLMLRFCRDRLEAECCDPDKVRLPRRLHNKVQFLTDQEIAQLLRVIPTHTATGVRTRALIEVLLSTGMRISEALSLNQTSIDPISGEAEVVGKGGKIRTVFFSRQCLAWIQRYSRSRVDSVPALFVTTGLHPRRLRRDDMSKLFARLKRRSGIQKRLTPHLLRHTFCTSLLHHGADIMFIKELAGHQDIQTTARYYLGVDHKSLRSVLLRCATYGWKREPDPIQSEETQSSDKRATAGAPAWPPERLSQDSTDTSSPDVRAPGFPLCARPGTR
jgi:integrase/recombinase XerD